MNNAASFKANQFAAAAEEYQRQGDFQNACTSHFRAAEQFLLAMNDTKDPELLYASHTRNGKELRKRLESPKLKEQVPERKPAVHLYSQGTGGVMKQGISESMMAASGLFVGQDQGDIIAPTTNLKVTGDSGPAKVIPDESPSSSIGQSYLILDRDAKEITADEEADPFNKFWEAVEGLVQKISNPVAFTSAPITESEIKAQADLNLERQNNVGASVLNSYLLVDPQEGKGEDRGRRSTPQSRSSPNSYQKKSIEEYEMENSQLKKTVDLLSKRIVELERASQENNLLRSSIIQFRQDIQKQRALNPQLFASIPPSNSLPPRHNNRTKLSMSVSPGSSSDTVRLQQQIEQLQTQLAQANETIAVQQRKWDKLKENVKKKRESKGSVSEILTEGQPVTVTQTSPLNSVQSPSQSGHSSLYYSVNQSRFG